MLTPLDRSQAHGIAGFLLAMMALALPLESRGAVKLPALFTDHAVLQRDIKVPVWGWAEPGEKVKVSIANQVKTAETDATGRWQVTLDPLAVGEPLKMIVEGKNRLEISDI